MYGMTMIYEYKIHCVTKINMIIVTPLFELIRSIGYVMKSIYNRSEVIPFSRYSQTSLRKNTREQG
jgi:hypothetical protein